MANSNPPDPRYGPAGNTPPKARHRPQYHQHQQQQQAHGGRGNHFVPPPVPPPVVGAAAAAGMGMPILISIVMIFLLILLVRIYALRMWNNFIDWVVPTSRDEEFVPMASPRSTGRKRE